MNWIKIEDEDQVPDDGDKVVTFFEHTGVEIATYKNLKGTKDEIFGHNLFYNKSGFLTDDVTHWMPYTDGMTLPEAPKE